MFPYPDDLPASFFEAMVGICIALTITLDLFSPEFGVRLGPRAMNWTPVPKASVYKYCYPGRTEYHVGATPQSFDEADVNPETQALAVDGRA